jgi:hypothetical protein
VALVAHGLGLRFLFGPEAMIFPAWMIGLHVANVLMMRAGGALLLRAVWPGLGLGGGGVAGWVAEQAGRAVESELGRQR